jgi:hypothetical protein
MNLAPKQFTVRTYSIFDYFYHEFSQFLRLHLVIVKKSLAKENLCLSLSRSSISSSAFRY